jgi:AGCS family alanine or glycine:cation symporter
MEYFLAEISHIVWGPVLILLLLGCGIFYTINLKFIQFRHFFHGLKAILGFYDHPRYKGEISHFQALCTALSATIGNIAGVATAISVGGPGAVFWIWVTGVLGMVTKFASCTLGHKYRVRKKGIYRGGPMYYIRRGIKNKPLALFFAVCCAISALGIGNMVQSNSVADAFRSTFGVLPSFTGISLGILVWLVIIGGIKRIARIAQIIVPFMCLFYLFTGLLIISTHFKEALEVLRSIFYYAFNPLAASGGFLGASTMLTVRMGIARGLFSNEAGLGSAPIAHAAAKTNEPVREGLVAMLGPFIDTLIVCTLTAMIILLSGGWKQGLTGASLTAFSFDKFLPQVGSLIVSLGIIFFAFSTMIGWSYYGEVAVDYFLGNKGVRLYRWIYCFAIPVGAILKLSLVWNLSDITNGLMAFPNLVALFFLAKIVVAQTKDYFSRHRATL